MIPFEGYNLFSICDPLRKRSTLTFGSFCPSKKKETLEYGMPTSNVHFITIWNERFYALYILFR